MVAKIQPYLFAIWNVDPKTSLPKLLINGKASCYSGSFSGKFLPHILEMQSGNNCPESSPGSTSQAGQKVGCVV